MIPHADSQMAQPYLHFLPLVSRSKKAHFQTQIGNDSHIRITAMDGLPSYHFFLSYMTCYVDHRVTSFHLISGSVGPHSKVAV